jgi:type II secretion system protein G
MFKNNSTKKGFTLIELLVVIAIIGLLSATVMSSLTTARKSAVASRRVTDLKAIRDALEIYYSDYNEYPVSSGWSGIYSCWGYQSTESDPNGWITGLTPKYIAALPREPLKTTNCNGQYIYFSNRTDYKIIVHNPPDCMKETNNAKSLRDPNRGGQDGCWAYGYWTTGGAGF